MGARRKRNTVGISWMQMMKRPSIPLLSGLILAVLLMSSPVQASDTATYKLKILVLDEVGGYVPLSGAHVSIDGYPAFSGITDESGDYSVDFPYIDGRKLTSITLTASRSGYNDFQKTIRVYSSDNGDYQYAVAEMTDKSLNNPRFMPTPIPSTQPAGAPAIAATPVPTTPAITSAGSGSGNAAQKTGSPDSSDLILLGGIGILVVGGGYGYSRMRLRKEKPRSPPESVPREKLVPESSPGKPIPLMSPVKEPANPGAKTLRDSPVREPFDARMKKTKADAGLVFISAKSEDFGYAEQVYSFLTSWGYPVFFSKNTLPAMRNSDYRKEIDRALDSAEHLIVVTSRKEYVTSSWVEAEWGIFINEKRSGRKSGNLITLIVDPMRIDDLPGSLRYYEVKIWDPATFDTILPYIS
jgi:hypothetical protein